VSDSDFAPSAIGKRYWDSVECGALKPVIDSRGWDPGLIGTEQVRYYAFDGQTVSFRTAALRLQAFPGGEVIGYVDWQRDYEHCRQLT